MIKRKTDIQFKFTDHLAYRVYGGYAIDKNRTVILPTTATPYYVGTGFSYSLNKKLQLKTGVEYQYNVVYKRWEWVWNSGIRFRFQARFSTCVEPWNKPLCALLYRLEDFVKIEWSL